MKRLSVFFALCSVALAWPLYSTQTQFPETKVIVQSIAASSFAKDAPCYMVYPEGRALEILQESGAIDQLESSLRELGYTIVQRESEAAVYVRVRFSEFEPYATELDLNVRPRIDYSNASSTRNHAAMMKGGRYQELANPGRNRDRNMVGAILGPEGEIIDPSRMEPTEPKVIETEVEPFSATVYPITFEVSAWSLDGDSENPLRQDWAVLATYNNLRDEETQSQLRDLSEIATRFLGKNLKKEKLIHRP
ncbi:hypothetical protein [Pelagicoccus sp. SDUM812003]|uniref:hypothetical protein n=1 Tax=Pelagicoccus sp. SDUM812003 TaxID=3041267 RepID=UPI00280F2C50|nr:hypothetical protein [Pelagicoccus sp. SDUM812003]MDQ8202264.1 hypothetical protein [Pelagicoccus sp. SDUM812003]